MQRGGHRLQFTANFWGDALAPAVAPTPSKNTLKNRTDPVMRCEMFRLLEELNRTKVIAPYNGNAWNVVGLRQIKYYFGLLPMHLLQWFFETYLKPKSFYQ